MPEKRKAKKIRRKQHLQNHHIIYADPENPRRQKDLTVMIRNGPHSIVSKINRYNGLTPQEVYAIVMAALMQLRFGDELGKLMDQFEELMEKRKA